MIWRAAKEKCRKDDGMIMVEALIVYLTTFVLLFFVLVLMFLVFQQWSCQIVANETAAKIGQTYSYKDAVLKTGEVKLSDITERKLYRSSKDYLEEPAKTKATDYSTSRLGDFSFAKFYKKETKTEIINDSISRQHIVVTMTGEFSLPFSSILEYVGYDGKIGYEFEGISPCYDIADYTGFVDFMHGASKTSIGGKLSGLIDSILKLVQKFLKG